MNKYTITIYEENDDSYEDPIGEVDIRATDLFDAEYLALLMFEKTSRLTSVKENNDE